MPVNIERKLSDNTQGQVSWWRKTYKGVRVFGLVFSSLTLSSISVNLLRWFPKSLPPVLVFLALYLGWSIVTNSRFHQLFGFALFVLVMLVHSLAFFTFSVCTIPLFFLTTAWSSLCIALSPAQRWVYAPKAVGNNLSDMIEYTKNGHPGDRQFIAELVLDFLFSACSYVLRHGSIVAVHGLAANVETTWSSDRHGKISWLKDKLPFVDGLDSRIFAFSYDSAYQGNALTKTLRDYGEELLRAIAKNREREEEAARPLILIGHSYGGLLIKQMLVSAQERNEEVCKHVVGVIFLGTPHRGSSLTHFGTLLSYFSYWSGSSTSLLDVVQMGSAENINLHRNFTNLRHNHIHLKEMGNIVCVFEAVRESFLGFALTHVVTPESAVIEFCVDIASDMRHRDMQRVGDDKRYEDILLYIKRWTKKCKEQVAAKLKREKEKIAAQQNEIVEKLVEENQECLRSLAFRKMNSREDEIESTRRPQNTCLWLLTNDNYIRWLGGNRMFLWIRGHPGTGKSVLTHYAYRKALEDQQTPSTDLAIAAFFCHDRGDPLQKTPLGLFRTLLYQLLPQIPSLLVEFVKYYEKRRQSTTEQRWEWSKEELDNFFLKELAKTSRQYDIRIFVDALDEFGKDTAISLMDYFHDLLERFSSSQTRIKICFSCRHYPLTGRFHSALTIEVENENRMDIETYIAEKTRPYLSDDTGPEEIEKINQLKMLVLEKARGAFLWVHLALQVVTRLDDWSEKELYEQVEKLPETLGDLYKNTFSRLDPQDRPKTLLLLQWVCFAVRPLTAAELRFAILLDEDVKSIQKCEESNYFRKQDTELRNLVKRLSCGLLEITNAQLGDQSVQFIHQSVKDYLILEHGLQSLDTNLVEGSGDYLLSRLCIRYLAMEEIIQLNYVKIPSIESSFPLLRYATTSWTKHSRRAEAFHFPQVGLFNFISGSEQKFLKQWVYIYQRIDVNSSKCPVGNTTLLHVLCRYGLLSLLSVCVDNSDADANAKDNYGRTALSWAAVGGYKAVVKVLLEKNVDVDSKDNIDGTALSLAARNGHEAVIKLLIEKNVNVDSKDINGRTALLWAAENGHEAVVKLLLERDVDVDSKDVYGRTALSWAAGNGHEAVVKLLLEKDVDVNSKDNFGETALSSAAKKGHKAVVKLLEGKTL